MNTTSTPTRRETSRLSMVPWMVVLFYYFAVVACSGGSGGAGGNASPVTYVGATTPAAITADNSAALISSSFEGALNGDAMVPFAAMGVGTENESSSGPTLTALTLQAVLADTLSKAVFISRETQMAPSESRAASSSLIYGDCGGTATYAVALSHGGGVYSGRLQFNDYCAGGMTLSGSATLLLGLDQNSDSFDYIEFTFSSLTTTANGESTTVAGSVSCDFQGSQVLITVDMVQGNGSDGLICWFDDYTIQVSASQMSISGRYYDPIEGYIDFETDEPLVFSGTTYPSSGVIVFTGAEGANGHSTSARLEAVSSTECRVTADFNGDGIFEYDSEVMPWAAL